MLDNLATFDEALTAALARWHMPITPPQLGRLRVHYETMVQANRTMNLTRISDPVESAVKHYADSLALLRWCEKKSIQADSVLDVGTGAGFPALPLAVMRPDWSVTAIDSTSKKISFLKRTAASIGLANLQARHARSEHWRPVRTFPLVVLRAVAPLVKCLEKAARHVSPGGRLVAYKTASLAADEARDALRVAGQHALILQDPFLYDLVLGDEVLSRSLQIFQKR